MRRAVAAVMVCAAGIVAAPGLAAPASAAPAVGPHPAFCGALAAGVRDLVAFGSVKTQAAALKARTTTDRDLTRAATLAPDHITRHEVRQERGDFDALVTLALADPHSLHAATAATVKRLTVRGHADAALLGRRAAALGCAPYLKR